MMTSRTASRTDFTPVLASGHGNERVLRRRRRVGGLLLTLAVVAAVVAGGWGVVSSLAAGAPPARIGEAAEVPGGILRVDKVTPEHMAPMQMKNFAKKGMSMSGMVPDMTPKGQRRFNVDVTLAAEESGGLGYSEDQFRVAGEGVKETGPLRSKLGSGEIPAGSAISNTLVFQVPEKADNLVLSFDGGRRIALDLPASKGGGMSHGN